MISEKSIALPVLVTLAILIVAIEFSEAGDVKVYNNSQELNIGNVWSDQTTVGQLKRLVATKTKVKLDKLRLASAWNNTLLEGEKLLSEYISIYQNELIVKVCDDLEVPGAIVVSLDYDREEFVVTKDKTLGWLKKEVFGDSTDLSLCRVVYSGRELTDDSKTLGELQFYKGAYVPMFKENDTFRVNVISPEDSGYSFDIKLDVTIGDLRGLLKKEGLDTDNHLLVHNGRVLENDTKVFSHSSHPFFFRYIINVIERLGSSLEKITLFQRKTDEIKHTEVLVKSSTTLRELKEFAFKADKSIQTRVMQLSLNNLILEGESRTLGEFNIYKGAWIQVSRSPKLY